MVKDMTPQEKAKELFEKFDDLLTYRESKTKTKECALIAVNEIIHESSEKIYRLGRCCLVDREYWQEVKQEIEKL